MMNIKEQYYAKIKELADVKQEFIKHLVRPTLSKLKVGMVLYSISDDVLLEEYEVEPWNARLSDENTLVLDGRYGVFNLNEYLYFPETEK